MQKYRVTVSALPEQRVDLAKSLGAIGKIGLQGAVDMINCIDANMPCVVADGLDREIAESIGNTLERARATVQVEETDTPLPMLLCPQINERAVWGGLRGRKSRW